MVEDPNKQSDNPFASSTEPPASEEGDGGATTDFTEFSSGLSNPKKRIIALAIVFLLLGGGAAYFYLGDPFGSDSDFLTDSFDEGERKKEKIDQLEESLVEDEGELEEALPLAKELEEDVLLEEEAEEKIMAPLAKEVQEKTVLQVPAQRLPAGRIPSLEIPADGASSDYDETSEGASFQWSGSPNGLIRFSRFAQMNPVHFEAKVRGGSHKQKRLYPGRWYWQVENSAGLSQVRSFLVLDPKRRKISIKEPQEGAIIPVSGGLVAWSGDKKVAYYRVELSMGDWLKPNYRFATSGTSLMMRELAHGSYQLRVGAFSELAGRWEYTDPIQVSIE